MAASGLGDGVCVVAVELGVRAEPQRGVLTVELSVRLVREGRSLLMVQVSVREPARVTHRRHFFASLTHLVFQRRGFVNSFF